MELPFNTGQFLDVFQNYNNSVYPVQIFFNLLALILIILAIKKSVYSDRIIISVLSVLWIWMGLVYHIIFFTSINKLAYVFGALFIVQGLLFALYGFRSTLSFKFKKGFNGYVSLILIAYALVIYPVIGYFSSHVYPKSPTFGLPCPTTIFTFGILLLIESKYPYKLFVIPLIWSVIGFSAAFKLGIYEDIGLLISGVIAIIVLFSRNRKTGYLF